MRKLLIVGAGGHGRCCLDIARKKNYYIEIVFLDDHYVNQSVNGCDVIGTTDEIGSFYPEYEDIFIAIGNNEIRKKLVSKAKEIGFHLINLISSFAWVSDYAFIGEGVVIFPNSVIEANCEVGNGAILAANTTINHDAKLEDFVLVYSNSVIRPVALIGSLSCIGSNAVISYGTKIDAHTIVPDGTVIKTNKSYSFEVGV